jgi:hypothetical protein
MWKDKLEVRIPIQKLLIASVLTIIPISVAGLYSITHSDAELEQAIGESYQTIARSSAAEVSQVIHELVRSVGSIAVESAILDAVNASNGAYQGQSDQSIAARIQSIDKAWLTPAAERIVNGILNSTASKLLRRHRTVDGRFLRITVTDAKGATVAATHKTIDYYQADEKYWQDIYAEGKGAISVTDILFDEITKSFYVGIGAPILEEGTSRFLGTVDALVDVSGIFPVVNRVQLGNTSRAIIVKDDGTIIAAPHVNLAEKAKSEEYQAAEEEIHAPESPGNGYLVTAIRGGPQTLIAYADTGLRRDYRNLGWVVLVAQDASEAFAPIRVAGRLIALMSLLGFGMVTLLAVYFALHREREFDEIGEIATEAAGKT